MVLQRETPMKLRGWGTNGDTIKAKFTRSGMQYSNAAVVGIDGRWKIELPSQPACADSCTLTFEIAGIPGTLVTYTNILIGDVWFAGGQSNMEKKVSYLPDALQVIAAADSFPFIRSFMTNYFQTNTPQERVNDSSSPWFVCNSSKVGDNVSAVAYIFALRIYNEQKIPIGIIQSYRGGTSIETWMSHDKIMSDPELCKVAGRISLTDSTSALDYPSCHFNGQINPLKGLPIKGFLFYQAESSCSRALEYRLMLKKLIDDWRTLWGMGDLPFYYVQLPNIGVNGSRIYDQGSWPDMREQQSFLFKDKITNIGMAVSVDTNTDPDNTELTVRMHPKNKRPVGERLALLALKHTYGENVIADSPVLTRYIFSNDTVYAIFNNYGAGLKRKDGDTTLKGFVIGDAGQSFKSANAIIINDSTILVTCSLISKPASLRYGWAYNPDCNLYNSADLAAVPFRTDIWKTQAGYQNYPSTCGLSNDLSLLAIDVSGQPVSNFNPSQLSYTVSIPGADMHAPQVTAITNSPFASVSVIQAANILGTAEQKKAKITVVAEDSTKSVSEVSFDVVTSINRSSDERVGIPGAFMLGQNYPNPFNPNTRINYELPEDENVDLRVYNVLGEEITRLVFEHRSAGRYSANFDGSKYASGLYYYKLTAGNFVNIKKMLLVK